MACSAALHRFEQMNENFEKILFIDICSLIRIGEILVRSDFVIKNNLVSKISEYKIIDRYWKIDKYFYLCNKA